MMRPGWPAVLSCRIAWNVTAPAVEAENGTSLHSMIRRLPSSFHSTALSVLPAGPLVDVVQLSHRTAMAACVGVVIRSLLVDEVVLVPNVIRPFALAKRLV